MYCSVTSDEGASRLHTAFSRLLPFAITTRLSYTLQHVVDGAMYFDTSKQVVEYSYTKLLPSFACRFALLHLFIWVKKQCLWFYHQVAFIMNIENTEGKGEEKGVTVDTNNTSSGNVLTQEMIAGAEVDNTTKPHTFAEIGRAHV